MKSWELFSERRKTMERILAISDIHGCCDELNRLLELVKYNFTTDQLILLGDYVDRGFKSKDVIHKIKVLTDEGAIALRGNHDQMFIDWLVSINSRMLLISSVTEDSLR